MENSLKVVLPFRYAGGKYYALKQLKPFWKNIEHDEYREPFLGGGAVFWAKPKVKYNWLNDLDEDLILTLKIIGEEKGREYLVKEFEKEKEATKEKYSKVRNIKPKNDLERAYKYYYLNRTSFSGKMRNPTWGYRPKRSLPPFRWKERIIPCGEKLKDVLLTTLDFEEAIFAPPKGKSVLIYLDPPYYHSKQENHYFHSFTKYDHIRLCSFLKRTSYNFFLSYDDSPEIRKLYDWAHIYKLSFFYRIDNSRDSKNRRRVGNELVISNYLVKNEQENIQFVFDFLKEYKKNEKKQVELPKRKAKGPIIEKVRSPIRFPGSKRQALKFISPFWESIEHDEYREPFLGGGAIFFAKPLAKINWLNDIDEDIILLFNFIKDKIKREELKKQIKKIKPTKELFYELRYSTPENEFERVLRYFVINRTAYSGIMHNPNWGYHITKSVPPSKWPDRIEQAGQKLEFAKLTNSDYEHIITANAEGKSVFMFVDPPYVKADQKRAYTFSFEYSEHEKLANLLKKTKFKFCLTYDDCNEVKELYKWANIHEFSWRYHTANSNVASRKMGKELIITNY